MEEKRMTEKEKLKQITKEAKATWISLLFIVIFWSIAGIGLARTDIMIFHTPLWAVAGCIGTWIFAIVVVTVLVKKVFKNFSLGEEEEHRE